MPLRTFRSSAGVEWRVWNVIPGHRGEDERRCGYDRRSPDPVILYRGPDRRVASDRRAQAARKIIPDEGWLVFESGSERRRLMPIPPNWEVRSDADLERLCGRAVPVSALRLDDGVPRGSGGDG
ncbi:MAG TPA: hypothetical protein VFJ16_08480 [Longimicrobium sp.]|nr:hypothetical protein [Longimicrobium sp.]